MCGSCVACGEFEIPGPCANHAPLAGSGYSAVTVFCAKGGIVSLVIQPSSLHELGQQVLAADADNAQGDHKLQLAAYYSY